VSGAKEMEESVKFGVVGSIQHPQIDYKKVIYSDAPWANEPWQAISYVSCHDNHTIYDKLLVSRRDAKERDQIEMNKLATAIVMTSQGTAFIHAGSEMLRTKYEEHNSYKSPDSINQFDWSRKVKYKEVFDYYQNLIKLRKEHPAFRMTSAEDVRKNLEFKTVKDGIVSYQINNNANGDSWKTIYVIYNANPEVKKFVLEPGSWNIGVYNDRFSNDKGYKAPSGMLRIPATSMVILYQK
jgi:pullulanase